MINQDINYKTCPFNNGFMCRPECKLWVNNKCVFEDISELVKLLIKKGEKLNE